MNLCGDNWWLVGLALFAGMGIGGLAVALGFREALRKRGLLRSAK